MPNYYWAFIIVVVIVALVFILPTPNIQGNDAGNNTVNPPIHGNGAGNNTANSSVFVPVNKTGYKPNSSLPYVPVVNKNTSTNKVNITELLSNQTCSKGDVLNCTMADGKPGIRICMLGKFTIVCLPAG